MLFAAAAAASPVLLGRAVDRLLGRRRGVHRGHQAFDDAEVVVDHLGQRRKAVGRARCVGNDGHVALVGFLVNAHDEHRRIRMRVRK